MGLNLVYDLSKKEKGVLVLKLLRIEVSNESYWNNTSSLDETLDVRDAEVGDTNCTNLRELLRNL